MTNVAHLLEVHICAINRVHVFRCSSGKREGATTSGIWKLSAISKGSVERGIARRQEFSAIVGSTDKSAPSEYLLMIIKRNEIRFMSEQCSAVLTHH